MNKALDFLSKTEWEYKEATKEQYTIKICPLCGNDKWKFYMSTDEGLWDCKICGEAGNLYQLKGKLGGISEISSTRSLFGNKKPLNTECLKDFEKDLEVNKEACEYLTKTRGYTQEIVKKFRLGSLDKDWIVIPHFQDGKLWNYKSRNFKNKAFKRVFGQPSILFNIDNLNKEKSTLVIVEGETDCIAAVQLGVENVVGLTTGASAFPPEWIPYTLRFKEIYVCLNSDSPGQSGAFKLAEKIGLHKCKNVLLPVKDVNEYLLTGSTHKDFTELLKKAKRFDVKNVSRMSEYIDALDSWLLEDGSLSGLKIPFQRVDKYLNGFKAEDLVLLSGDTGVGKTTISLNILQHFIKEGHRCLGFFLEGKIMYYIMRMMSMETKIEYAKLNENEEEWKEIKTQFSEYPLFFYSGAQSELDTKKLKELLEAAVKLYDIEFVFIDNLQKFVKDDRFSTQETSQTISVLKNLAVDLNIPILLITHIRKPEKDRKRVSMHDAKNSSTIYQEADIYLTLWNNKNRREDIDDMKLTIEKNRMGEGGIDTDMIYEKEIGVYRESISGIDDVKKNKKIKKAKTEEIDAPVEEEDVLDEFISM